MSEDRIESDESDAAWDDLFDMIHWDAMLEDPPLTPTEAREVWERGIAARRRDYATWKWHA